MEIISSKTSKLRSEKGLLAEQTMIFVINQSQRLLK